MNALATEDETLPWPKTRVGVFDDDDRPDFPGSAHSSWVYASGNDDELLNFTSDNIEQLEPVAEMDGAGNVVARFVYATKGHSPDYVIKDGSTFRILSDHLGSPRLVVNVDTGAVDQRMDFDEWGVVTLDTSPGWQPFGFAGGLLDADTGLTRFGARDYAAAEGIWTAKDPIQFLGGSLGLFEYVGNDPINFVDPSGLDDEPITTPPPGWNEFLERDRAYREYKGLCGEIGGDWCEKHAPFVPEDWGLPPDEPEAPADDAAAVCEAGPKNPRKPKKPKDCSKLAKSQNACAECCTVEFPGFGVFRPCFEACLASDLPNGGHRQWP